MTQVTDVHCRNVGSYSHVLRVCKARNRSWDSNGDGKGSPCELIFVKGTSLNAEKSQHTRLDGHG